MSIHREISFETEICQHLSENGWLYAEGDAAGYDRKRVIYPPDVLAWVQETQPKAWETLVKNHGAQAEETLMGRLRDQLNQRGTLDVLRHGIELLGLKQPLKLAEFKPAQQALKIAKAKDDDHAAEAAKNEMDALTLFKGDMSTFIRLYTFLSQIFDYGNTAIEKRAIFFKRLLPLLELGREREGIDLSKVQLTRHKLTHLGKSTLSLYEGEASRLSPLTEVGSGMVRDQEKIYMGELIEKLNQIFGSETSDQDQLVYARHVIMGKLLESELLQQQAANNTKEQFSNSPDLNSEFKNATIASLDAHTTMATQILNNSDAQRAMLDLLLNQSRLWETLRGQWAS